MTLRWTPAAAGDLVGILDYVRERSPRGASRLRDRFRQVEEIIRTFPEHGRPVQGSTTLRRTVAAPFPYFVFYEIVPDGVIIRHIRHTSRRPPASID